MLTESENPGKKTFLKDLLASVVVFLVALPLCMGIAVASGVPPALGLITGIIGGLVVGLFAGAPLAVSGPAAGLTVLVFEIIRTHGIGMLGPIVLVAGLIQLLAGYLRLGQWFRAVSPSVIHGMLGGIGALILVSQFHVMLDAAPKGSGLANLLAIPGAIWSLVSVEIDHPGIQAGLVGLITIALMAGWSLVQKTPLRVVPAPLVAVVCATLFVHLTGSNIQRVALPESLVSALSFPNWESLSNLFNPKVLASIFSLALIASAETLLCASALTKLRADAKSDYDKELVAQGIGNSLCGLLGALPMTGVIVRSTANIQGGAQTRWSAVFHGVWLLVFVALAPQLLRLIPMASLAAILVFTGYKLLNPYGLKRLARYGQSAVVLYLITLVGIVTIDLLTGVLLGVAASLLRLVHTISGLRIVREETERGLTLQLKGNATVFSLPRLARTLESLPLDKPVTLNVHKLYYLDHACMDLIETIRVQRTGTPGELHLDAEQLRFKYLRSQQGPALAQSEPENKSDADAEVSKMALR